MELFHYYNTEKSVEYAWYKSSNVHYTEYHDNTGIPKEMIVVFNNGARYKYEDVLQSDYLFLRENQSQGKAFNWLLKEKKWKMEKLTNVDIADIDSEYEFRTGKGLSIINEENKMEIKNTHDTVLYSIDKKLDDDTLNIVTDVIKALGFTIRKEK
jgi:hypothetical protein